MLIHIFKSSGFAPRGGPKDILRPTNFSSKLNERKFGLSNIFFNG